MADQGIDGASVLLGNGDATFTGGGSWPGAYSEGQRIDPVSVVKGDFNGDGAADLVLANSGSHTVSLLLGIGSTRMQPFMQYGAPVAATGRSPSSATLADFDGDGRPDIVVTNGAGADVSILLTSCLVPTTTVLSSSANPVSYGQPATLTATVSPSGGGTANLYAMVNFWQGTYWWASYAFFAGTEPSPSQHYHFFLNGLPGGTYPITAKYSGNLATASSESSVVVQVVEAQADLSITVSDGQTATLPGSPITYTIVASNLGPHPIFGATITDTVPSAIEGAVWTCVKGVNPAIPCGSGTGNISDTVGFLSVGSPVTYTLTGTISAGASGSLTNTASVTAPGGVTDSSSSNNSATDVTSLVLADLLISKTDGQVTAFVGAPITYTIVVSNAGPDPIGGATVTDSMPAALEGVTWTCEATGGATCTSSGSGSITDSVAVPVGATVAYIVHGSVSPSASGTLSNTATVTVSNATDPDLGDNSATDESGLVVAHADLAIIKTDGQSIAFAGAPVTYTIGVFNAGPNPAAEALIVDTLPAGLQSATWVCVATAGGSCTPSGTGNISDIAALPVGASVTYTLTATLVTPPASVVTNTASVTPSAGTTDPDTTNNEASDTDMVNACTWEISVVPDGRRVSTILPAGGSLWLTSLLSPARSYSVGFESPTGQAAFPGTVTVFGGMDFCWGPSSVETRETSSIDPSSASGTRVSFTTVGPVTLHRARLVNDSGAPLPITFSWAETTLYSPTWSVNGSYVTYYSFHNSTSAAVRGTLILWDSQGTALSASVTVPAHGIATLNTASLGLSNGTGTSTGTATLVHDGPPGAIQATAAIANFSSTPAYVQPVKFEAVRDGR